MTDRRPPEPLYPKAQIHAQQRAARSNRFTKARYDKAKTPADILAIDFDQLRSALRTLAKNTKPQAVTAAYNHASRVVRDLTEQIERMRRD